MSMTSEEAREQFDAYLDEELAASERAPFEAALSNDPDLQRDFEEYQRSVQFFQSVPTVTPSDRLIEATQHRIRRRQRLRDLHKDGAIRYRMEIALCAVLVIGLVAIGGMSLSSSHSVPSPYDTANARLALGRLSVEDRAFLEKLGGIVEARVDKANTLRVVLNTSSERKIAVRESLSGHATFAIEAEETSTEEGMLRLVIRYTPEATEAATP
jgi:hypothetical protein